MSKPDRNKAPGWAMWLAQDNDGTWYWWEREPVVTGGHDDFWMSGLPGRVGKFMRVIPRGVIPVDWTKTLEPRPC